MTTDLGRRDFLVRSVAVAAATAVGLSVPGTSLFAQDAEIAEEQPARRAIEATSRVVHAVEATGDRTLSPTVDRASAHLRFHNGAWGTWAPRSSDL